MSQPLTVGGVLTIIDTRIDLHAARVARLNPATENYQRLLTWHHSAVETLRGLRDEIVNHQAREEFL